MATKFLDYNGVLYFWQKIKSLFVSDVTYDSTSKKIQKVKNGNPSDIVTLSTVATSGSYSDLSNKPTIPTKTSDLTNDSGFITDADIPEGAFIATYGTTTYAELVAAYENGDTIILKNSAGSKTDYVLLTSCLSIFGTYTFTFRFPSSGSSFAVYTCTSSGWSESSELIVPGTRTVNGHALSSDVTLSASDVSAIPTSAKGAASGVCPLDTNSKVDAQYLPSYVDDVIEAYARSGQTALSQNWLATGSASGTVITPEAGKIYVLMADSGDYTANTQFRWGGSSYVKLNDGGVSSITNAEIDTIVAS